MVKPKKPFPSEVELAQRRAAVIAFVNQGGKEVKVSDVSEKFGIEHHIAKQTLNSLEASKQVDVRGGGARGVPKFYAPSGFYNQQKRDERTEQLPAVIAPSQVQMVKQSKRKEHLGSMPMGVEVVIGGIPITITRNPANGRPRIEIS